MIRRHFARAAVWALLLATAFSASAGDESPNPVDTGGEFIVRMKSENIPPSLPGQFLRRVDARTVVVRLPLSENIPGNSPQTMRAPSTPGLPEMLRENDDILFAEPNHPGYFAALPPVPAPDDPGFGQQWWLGAVGAQSLWAVHSGEGSLVAVVDSGVDVLHPDLAPNIVPGGYNFGDDNEDLSDYFGHGTAVAGAVAAVCGNGLGGCGLAPRAGILPLKINAGGEAIFLSDRLASAVRYAADHGAKIINLSVYVTQETELVREAIQAALDRGIIVVAAAGNNYGGPVAFPANMPGVVAVAASTRDGKLLDASNIGPEIAVAAPGENIYSTAPGGTYGLFTGTSMSAPIVSATLAAMSAASPFLPAQTLIALLKRPAHPLQGRDIGIADAGASADLLLPRLFPVKAQYRADEAAEVSWTLPPVGRGADIYVAATTPEGEVSFSADGGWHPVAQTGYLPFVRGISIGASGAPAMSGVLFGDGGLYPALPLEGLPPGAYAWRIAVFVEDENGNARLIGAINHDAMEILP